METQGQKRGREFKEHAEKARGLSDTTGIDQILRDNSTVAYEARLQGMHDFEALAWQHVGVDGFTSTDAEEAIGAFVRWVETGDSGLTV